MSEGDVDIRLGPAAPAALLSNAGAGSSARGADAPEAPAAVRAARDPADSVDTAALQRSNGPPLAVGALLVSAALLRIGVVGSTLAVLLDLNDLADSRPNPVALGLVLAGQSLSEMVWSPILARYADRFGRRRFLIFGPLLGAICSLLVGLAGSPLQIGGIRLLEGMAAAAFVPTALGLLAAATSRSGSARAQASGAFEAATLVGYAGGALVGPWAWHYMHRGAFILTAALYVVAALVCARLVPRVPPMPVSPLRHVVRTVLGPGPIRAFLPAWVAVNALVAAFYIHIPALLKRSVDPQQVLVRHLDERLITPILLVWIGTIIIGIALWTPTLRRLGPVTTMRRAVPGALLLVVGLALMNHVSMPWSLTLLPLAVAGTLWMSGFGPAAVVYLADTSEHMAADRSALMAFYTLSLAAGGAVGAVLGGVAARWRLFDGLLALGAGLVVVAVGALRQVEVLDPVSVAASEATASAKT